jgi:glycosyltransferase involved in cell wall biosynthesis
VNLFDKVLCISSEELDFFSKFAKNPAYFYVPLFMNKVEIKEQQQKEFDLLFVGFDNYSNINGINWFFEKIYTLLSSDIKILIVGKITKHIDSYPNVTKLSYVEKIDEVYFNSKISINPLIDGTGMKVKVIESLAHGVPVVSTSRGLVGIPKRFLGKFLIADNPDDFAKTIHQLLSDKNLHRDNCETAYNTFMHLFEKNVVINTLNDIFS